MKKILFTAFCGLCWLFSVQAQTSDASKDFDFLVSKIKDDYAGYKDKVNPEKEKELKKLEKELRGKIEKYPDSCQTYFICYTSWFKDRHLWVGGVKNKKSNTQTTNNVKPKIQMYSLNVDSLQQATQDKKTIEGVWCVYGQQISIVKKPNEDQYLAIANNYSGYQPNQVMYEFVSQKENEFSFVSNWGDSKASLHLNNQILELHGLRTFVRKSNTMANDLALLFSYCPQYPNGSNWFPLATSIDDSTFYLRIYSFDNKDTEEMVKRHWSEIVSRPYLVVDIRFNRGGLDQYYQPLMKLIYSNPYTMKGVEWCASKGNISFFEEALKNGEIRNGQEGIRWTHNLISEMKKNIGGFVLGNERKVVFDTVYSYPRKVGIIINESNASAAEQFILEAKESKKVVLFGNKNTRGVLDYSNAVPINFPSGRYQLNYPMTRSCRLPQHPIDNIGIAPDVLIPYPSTDGQIRSRLDDWAYFVAYYFLAKDLVSTK